MRKSVVVVCLFVLCAQEGFALGVPEELYVATTGSDAETTYGTKSDPLQTLGGALDRIPESIDHSYIIYVRAGIYPAAGGIVTEGGFYAEKTMAPDTSVRIIGMNADFSHVAAPGDVVFDWAGTQLLSKFGEWSIEHIQLGSGQLYQEGVSAEGQAIIHLRDVRIRGGSFQGAGISANYGGAVLMAGTVEVNEHLHTASLAEVENKTSRLYATNHGIIRFEEQAGSDLSVGNGNLSAEEYGLISLGTPSARVSSSVQEGIAINSSGRVNLLGTALEIFVKNTGPGIGPEDDGHINAAGSSITMHVLATYGITLQKVSKLFADVLQALASDGTSLSPGHGMSGSSFMGSVVGVGDTSNDTGAFTYIEKIFPDASGGQAFGCYTTYRGGQVFIEPTALEP